MLSCKLVCLSVLFENILERAEFEINMNKYQPQSIFFRCMLKQKEKVNQSRGTEKE